MGKSGKDGSFTAVRDVVATAGKAVFFSGGTVFVSMLAVLFINVPTVRSIAIGASIVVLMAVLVSKKFSARRFPGTCRFHGMV